MAGSLDNEQWRIIISGKKDGAYNMALDMAMAEAAADEKIPPTLRLYGWNPPAISMGYHQRKTDVDFEKCRELGLDVVLRPTGGRAILHDNELTYAVVLPPVSRYFTPDIHGVYKVISKSLVAGLQELNIPVEFERTEKTPKDFNRGEFGSLCYASSIQNEIRVGNKKLVGSAQRRIRGAVLQHGSILIGPEHLDIVNVLTRGDDKWKENVRNYMHRHTVCLNELSPVPLTVESVRSAVMSGFQKELQIDLIPSRLTAAECDRAAQLYDKFSIIAQILTF